MTVLLYVVGPTAAGKSTLLSGLMRRAGLTLGPAGRVHGQLFGHPLLRDGEQVGHYLGRDRPDYPGTDALGYAAGPVFEDWIAGTRDRLVIGEGARLGTRKALTSAARHSNLVLVHLSASWDTTSVRVASRSKGQTDQFRLGAMTRARRAFEQVAPVAALAVDVASDRLEAGPLADEAWSRVSGLLP